MILKYNHFKKYNKIYNYNNQKIISLIIKKIL